jgi:hypothetical protein
MANQYTRYATIATVDTAGEGYFIGVGIQAFDSLTATSTIVSANDQVRVFQFVLPFRAVVRNIVSQVGGTPGAGGSKYGMGLYDVDKNLLLETGALAADASGRIRTTITAVTLEPGVYFFAQTVDDSTATFLALNVAASPFDALNEGTTKRVGSTANAASAGVLPATLGVITASTTRKPAFVLFEP